MQSPGWFVDMFLQVSFKVLVCIGDVSADACREHLSAETSADAQKVLNEGVDLTVHIPAEHRLTVGICVQVSAVCRVRQIAHECRCLQNPAGGSGHGSIATCRCQSTGVGM